MAATTETQHHHKHRHSKRRRSSRRRRNFNSDDSDVDSLTEELDQIGRLNLNINLNLASYISKDSFNLPNLPNMPNMPNLPNLPTFELSKIQEFPKEFSRYVSSYIDATKNYYSNGGNSTVVDDGTVNGDTDVETADTHEQQRLVNSIKTVLSTRIQMNKFLNDLKLGVNISTAIDRLQPLTDIIHETIFLPAEDISDFEDDYDVENGNKEEIIEEITEPVGVGQIVNQDQPLLNEIVKPESHSSTYKKRSRRKQLIDSADDSGTQTSDLDNIDGLTLEQIKALTDLNSLEDFSKEELLRTRIHQIQNLNNITQKAKNKLVTRLMMGNYYKYVNEKLLKENKSELLPSKLKRQKLVLNNEIDQNDGDSTTVEDTPSATKTTVRSPIIQEEEMEVEPVAEIPQNVFITEQFNDEEDIEETDDDEVDEEPSFHDPPFNTIMGCPHYQRNCKLECPTCLKWYPCRFCHDSEVTTHKLVRSEVKHILCMKCNTPQNPETNYCMNCESELAYYFCNKCVLYDNDHTKDIYHCDKCGICRLGLGIDKDYFHCDEYLREKHKCLSNTTHCDCPICNEYLFTSVHKVVFMKCGHSIHQHCYDELVKHSYKCPICKKTIVNVETQFRLLDQEIAQSPLPSPYNAWRCIISCNDCKGKSNTSYHVLGLKCKYCKSYNTNQLKLIKPEEEEEDEEINADDEESRTTSFDINLMRSVRTNLSSNFRIDEQSIHDENSGYEDENEDGDVADDEDERMEEQTPASPSSDNRYLVNFRRLTSSVTSSHGKDTHSQSNISYITSIFQNFINNATTSRRGNAAAAASVTKTNDATLTSTNATASSTSRNEEAFDSDYDFIGGF
ncbi:uncharacterized protein RJT20DRAFT_146025 [Scheffersomyces xylosifermentans]|uniref:uncharacterized protein n=1 Tax=Scheffersomyces xylosifermentans TaxID=1304137 RepID=UPI00315DA107